MTQRSEVPIMIVTQRSEVPIMILVGRAARRPSRFICGDFVRGDTWGIPKYLAAR
jgi:hypothetical protein